MVLFIIFVFQFLFRRPKLKTDLNITFNTIFNPFKTLKQLL